MSKKSLAAFAVILSVVLAAGSLTIGAQSLTDLQKTKGNVTSEKNDLQYILSKAKNEKNSLLEEITQMDIQIEELSENLDYVTGLLDQTNDELASAEEKLAEATATKDEQMSSLIKRLRVMDENGSMAYLQIIFSSSSIVELLNRFENIKSIADYDRNLFNELEATEATIAEEVATIDSKKKEIEILLNEQTAKKHALEESAQQKNLRVTVLNNDEQTYLKQIKDLEKTENEIQATILKAQADAAHAAAVKAQLQREAAAKLALNQTYTGGMIWPLPGYTKLSSGYINRTNPISGRREFHTGLDIPAPRGTTIVAASAGVVIISGTNLGGFGYSVVIDHGGGISTQYSHCSKLLVKVGDSVSQGDKIALVGSTGYSTGNHLHFEVHVNGAHTNPTAYVKP